MSKSIIGIAHSNSQVERTMDELQEDAHIAVSDISVLMPGSFRAAGIGTVRASKAAEGTVTGTLSGSVVGLLAGIGTLAIPGLGSFIAAGPIIAALGGAGAGATAGGIIGALVGWGIPEYEAKGYQERLKEGGYLVAAHVQDNEVAEICVEIMRRNGLKDISLVKSNT
jgi:uncharacterized membrane protein